MTLKFFYNGIKASDGKLQKASYSDSPLHSYPAGTITIYAKRYRRFSAEIAEQFKVENNSDYMTDYFENDTIRVVPFHPLYAQVKAACDKQAARWEAKHERRMAPRARVAA